VVVILSESKKILITGANGFIGSHLLKYFSEKKGYRTAGLVRKTSDLFRLSAGQFDLQYAAVNDPMDKIMKGCDVVIHTAAKASDWGNYDEHYRINVEGTLNLLKTAHECGVERFIYISSTVVYGFGGHINTNEDKTSRPFHNNYCITKTIAEQKVQEYRDRLRIIVLRPSNVYGPWDMKFTYPLLRSIYRGLFAFPDGGKNLTSPCYIKNIISAVEKAIEARNHFGEAYNISDGNDIPWRLFLSLIAEEMGKKPPWFPVPSSLLFFMATLMERLFVLFRSQTPPLITPYRIAISSKDYSFSIEKSKKQLHFVPQYTTQEGIKESVGWYYEYSKQSTNTPPRVSP